MVDRLYLQTSFEEILGTKNVYFQPPPSLLMAYPAIVYTRRNISVQYANNSGYILRPGYEVTLIDEDPDSEYIMKILQLPYCRFERHFTSDNLNHEVFSIY